MTITKRILCGMLFGGLGLGSGTAFGQGTAFTYQGYLNESGHPANGNYDLSFLLYSTNTGGNVVAAPLTNVATGVSNGLFTVSLDFGNVPFAGDPRWLEIAVRTNGGGVFTALGPRQQITPVPFAVTAVNLSGPLPATSLGGAYANAVTLDNRGNKFAGDGGGLTNVNAHKLHGKDADSFWGLAGNTGSSSVSNFLGTIDVQPLELRANGRRALRLEPNTNGAPNIIGGTASNVVNAGAVGVVIGGGGAANYGGAGFSNRVASDFGIIAGGGANYIWPQSPWGAIGGGYANVIGGPHATIAGGVSNAVGSLYESIGGGFGNEINAYTSLLYGKPSDGAGSTISGGLGNGILDGYQYYTDPVRPGLNTIGGGGTNLILATGGGSSSSANAIAGGSNNGIYGNAGGHTIGGGSYNEVGMPNGGSDSCVIAGGFANVVVGGESFSRCTISGGAHNTIGDEGNFFEGDTIGGGENNLADGTFLTIGGGYYNAIEGNYPYPSESTIGGGWGNIMRVSSESTIAGGAGNQVSASDWAAVSGGERNVVTNCDWAAIGGGSGNIVSGSYGAVPGGHNNSATTSAFAAGSGARATTEGTFVWSDSTSVSYDPVSYPTPGGGTNSFNVRATGGLYFVTAVNATNGQPTSGMYISAGGSGWNTYSDRNAKTNFASVDGRDILNRLAAIPILRWNYKTQDPSVQHLGPMAQDFNAAFDLGEGDKSGQKKYIHSLDIDGVALAAIQGLNTELKERDAKIQSLERDVADLKSMVKSLLQESAEDSNAR
ncbi:MAG TPA: tail fiber domain-containing protein [Verrucomicrobiae bacterium]|nr:tail fiber domain-containing protein [Verrucomicrobiae bacterium]